VIIITGPGRSGTSVLSALYHELGFDPGGSWWPEINAGLEDIEVVAANDLIARDLRLTMLGPARGPARLTLPEGSVLSKISKRCQLYFKLNSLPGRRARTVRLFSWDRLDEVAAQHGPHLKDLAATRLVAKDPRFMWTLPVWIKAGADVGGVILTTRNMQACLASNNSGRFLSFSSQTDARNSLIYGLGVCIAACTDADISYRVLQFPHFLDDVELLAGLPLLRDRARGDVEAAARRLVKPDLVHF
jgi:hypothetical protein